MKLLAGGSHEKVKGIVIELREYRGVPYSIPSNDDGVWRYKLHPCRLGAKAARPSAAPAGGYDSRSEAITAAQKAVDDWLGRAAS